MFAAGRKLSLLGLALSVSFPAAAEPLTRDQYVKAWSNACQSEVFIGALTLTRFEADTIRAGIHIYLESQFAAVKAFGGKPTRTLDQFKAEACTCAARKLAARGGDLRKPPANDKVTAAVRSCTESIRMLAK